MLIVRVRKGRTTLNQSISFTPELLARVKVRALVHGLSVSHYVRLCIQREMDSPEPLRVVQRLVAEEPLESAQGATGSAAGVTGA